jgi:hypothetical protein
MKHVTRIGRLAGLAVGLGIGAALAATPGVASADDFQISIDGMDLFPMAGNTATATSGMGDFAIAIGDGADATATGGSFDSAFADGTNSSATSGDGNFDYASANGAGSSAGAGIGSGDTALASGIDSSALASGDTVTDAAGTTTYPGNDDVAFALGQDTMAGSGTLFSETASSNDIAMVFDPFGTEGSEALAGIGNFDLAAAFGDMLHAVAPSGNFMVGILPML